MNVNFLTVNLSLAVSRKGQKKLTTIPVKVASYFLQKPQLEFYRQLINMQDSAFYALGSPTLSATALGHNHFSGMCVAKVTPTK